MTSPQRPRAAATPTASPEGVTAERDDLIERLKLQAKTMDAHARSRRGQLWPGDNDYEDSARVMRAAADTLLAARQEIEQLTEKIKFVVRENRACNGAARLNKARAEAAESALAAQAQRRDEVVEALHGLLDRYTELVNCGDCGYWDPEKEPVVTASRAALNTPEPK